MCLSPLPALAALILLAAGCEAPREPEAAQAATAAEGPIGFRCPAEGMEVVFDTGYGLTYRAPSPLDPAVCLVLSSAGPLALLYNFYYLPLHDHLGMRRIHGRLWPMQVGNEATLYLVTSNPVTGVRIVTREDWRVERRERRHIAGAERDTFVVARNQETVEGGAFAGHQTYWYDTATGLWVKRTVEVTRGGVPEPAYEAVSIRVPQ